MLWLLGWIKSQAELSLMAPIKKKEAHHVASKLMVDGFFSLPATKRAALFPQWFLEPLPLSKSRHPWLLMSRLNKLFDEFSEV